MSQATAKTTTPPVMVVYSSTSFLIKAVTKDPTLIAPPAMLG